MIALWLKNESHIKWYFKGVLYSIRFRHFVTFEVFGLLCFNGFWSANFSWENNYQTSSNLTRNI